ncbi:hypothetical protein [Lysinibacillus sp. FJAT-14222]|uniref:hypothetical protein n=1 Tax=Lysinibacillus sp. FJAT-14222 TaxID=1932366 RepID=UPI0011608627|nr:hypothetical protein [Lysinibacillus sp. FJAT-14222]
MTNIGAAAASLSRKKHLLARDPAAQRMFSVRKRSANVAAANVLSVRKRSDSNNKSGSSDAPRKLCSVRQRQCFICAKAKRTMFYLCESEATATMFYLCESEATATMRPVATEINHTLGSRLTVPNSTFFDKNGTFWAFFMLRWLIE